MTILFFLGMRKIFESVISYKKKCISLHAHLGDIPTVTEQELQAMRMGWFYRLTHVNQPDLFKHRAYIQYTFSNLHQVILCVNINKMCSSPSRHATACYTH